ncbi:MAG: ImmA/IrrE family metallo-endopeptidase [Pseudobdellovibrionaceae bacterium]
MLSISQAMQKIKEHQSSIPVNVIRIANDLGMKVYSVPDMNGTLSGMIRKNPESRGGFDIFVNGSHSDNRRRFTIAHEIAHAVLHPHLIGDGITDDALLRSGLSNSVEAQANSLAADILMPWEKLNECLERGITSLDNLAEMFGVSKQAMAIRIGVPQD